MSDLPLFSSQPTSLLLCFLSPAQLVRGLIEWPQWVCGIQPGSVFERWLARVDCRCVGDLLLGAYPKLKVEMEKRAFTVKLKVQWLKDPHTLTGVVCIEWSSQFVAVIASTWQLSNLFFTFLFCLQHSCKSIYHVPFYQGLLQLHYRTIGNLGTWRRQNAQVKHIFRKERMTGSEKVNYFRLNSL